MERIAMGNIVLADLIVTGCGLFSDLFGQCPSPGLYDPNSILASANPVLEIYIVNTVDSDQFTCTVFSPVAGYGLYSGRGPAPVSGVLREVSTPIFHAYNPGIYTLSETSNECTVAITDRIITDRKTGATAIVQIKDISGGVPHALAMLNQPASVSPCTVLEWDCDGIRESISPETAYPVVYVYERARDRSNLVVSITVLSLFDTMFSSNEAYYWQDIDKAVVTACVACNWVEQKITFADQSLYHCNVGQPGRIGWNVTKADGGILGFISSDYSGCTLVNVDITELFQTEFSYTDPGTYVIELKISNSLGCGSKKTATVSVHPAVSSIPDSDPVSIGIPIHFTDKSLLYEKRDDMTSFLGCISLLQTGYYAFRKKDLTQAFVYKSHRKYDQAGLEMYYYTEPLVLGEWYSGHSIFKQYKPGWGNNDALTVFVGIGQKFGYAIRNQWAHSI